MVTQDAHSLYSLFGFKAPEFPEWMMKRRGSEKV